LSRRALVACVLALTLLTSAGCAWLRRPVPQLHAASRQVRAGQSTVVVLQNHGRPFLRDSRDDMVVEVAVASGANVIVTHNLRDFAGVERFNIRALSAAAFLKQLGGSR
jgi:predicted nucleic acid-binding protein